MPIFQDNVSRIETNTFTILVHSRNPHYMVFDNSYLEIIESIFKRFEQVDMDLIYDFLCATDGKYLSYNRWKALIKTVKDFE